MKAIYDGLKTLYPPQGEVDYWLISMNESWLPGAYDSEEAARLAFDYDGDLQALQDTVSPGPITRDLLLS